MAKSRWALLAAGLVVVAAAVILLAKAESPPDVHVAKTNGPELAWGEPKGKPRGVVMLLPGGGWNPTRRAFQEQLAGAATLRKEGYATVVVLYRNGPGGFGDVEETYRRARERYPSLPICASGISSGGHLALMLATREHDLACVVDVAGPTDLTRLREQGVPRADRRAATNAFGKRGLAKWSPVRSAGRIDAPVLMVLAPNDPVVPVEQGNELAEALPGAELFLVDPDSASPPVALFHFARVTPESVEAATQRILGFLADATKGG